MPANRSIPSLFAPLFLLSLSALVMSACGTARAPQPSTSPVPAWEDTPVPTVPPATPAPATVAPAEATPVPTRPVGKPAASIQPGQPTGPTITHLGAARADGLPVEPESLDRDGTPTFLSVAGSGFIIVVEGVVGPGGHEVGRRTFVHKPDDKTLRPDLEIQANRDLGNGSKEVCDRRRPNMGGVPGINPPSFDETQPIADALNDFACRFETFLESDHSCTVNAHGNYSFVDAATTHQFCVIVAKSFSFPEGITEVRVRLKDVEGNPGPIRKIKVRRPKAD